MTWTAEHWLEFLTGEYGSYSWTCACGASGQTRRRDQAASAFGEHFAQGRAA